MDGCINKCTGFKATKFNTENAFWDHSYTIEIALKANSHRTDKRQQTPTN